MNGLKRIENFMSKIFSKKENEALKIKARKLRKIALKMIYKAQAPHLASAFSALDILVFLYHEVLQVNPKEPTNPKRDIFILSKGWGASALYAVLSDKGFFPKKWLETYCADGSKLIGITTLSGVPGIEATTGSMGHGLPLGAGMAIAAKKMKSSRRVFVVMSDGELDEGSTWEAILFAGFQKLDNLVVIIDYNKFQSFGSVKEVLDTEPIGDKFCAFRWNVLEVNGHDFLDMRKTFTSIKKESGKPTVIIANTIKGRGISFMENQNKWHYKYPNEEEFQAAVRELENMEK